MGENRGRWLLAESIISKALWVGTGGEGLLAESIISKALWVGTGGGGC